jgi:TonB family protein
MRNPPPRCSPIAMLLFAALTCGCAGGPASREAHNTHHLPNTRDYYPDKAKCLGLTGRVGLEFTCDKKGRAHNITVVESAGPLLDRAATELVSEGRFTPGNPVDTPGRVGVIFQLTNKPRVPPFEDNRQTVTVTGLYPPVWPTSCK